MENDITRNRIMKMLDKKEKIGWMILTEKAMKKTWNNKKDKEFFLKVKSC